MNLNATQAFCNDLRIKLQEMTKYGIFESDKIFKRTSGERVRTMIRNVNSVALMGGLLKIDLNEDDGPREKKAAWAQENGYRDVFLLPLPFSTIESEKLYGEKVPDGLIINYDHSKDAPRGPSYMVWKLLGGEREADLLPTGLMLKELHQTLEIKKHEEDPQGTYRIFFDTKIREDLLNHVKEHDAWKKNILGIIPDIYERTIMAMILGELSGEPSPDSGFKLKT